MYFLLLICFFLSSVKTKEEIAQRNINTKINKVTTANNRRSEQSTIEDKAGQVLQLNNRQISFNNFTESDRRNVIQKFLSSQEVLFLIYGLMFPSQTIAAANQALNS